MNYKKQCDCCGHQITAYSHNINAQLVQALEQLVRFFKEKGRECNLQKNLNLTKNQYNNFQKLQYFGLVYKGEKGWLPTNLAVNFMNGTAYIQNPVATYGKEILPIYHEAWSTAEKKPKTLYVHQVKNYDWKGREDYVEEKRNTLFQ